MVSDGRTCGAHHNTVLHGYDHSTMLSLDPRIRSTNVTALQGANTPRHGPQDGSNPGAVDSVQTSIDTDIPNRIIKDWSLPLRVSEAHLMAADNATPTASSRVVTSLDHRYKVTTGRA